MQIAWGAALFLHLILTTKESQQSNPGMDGVVGQQMHLFTQAVHCHGGCASGT